LTLTYIPNFKYVPNNTITLTYQHICKNFGYKLLRKTNNFWLIYICQNYIKKTNNNSLTLYFAKWHLWNNDFESVYLAFQISKKKVKNMNLTKKKKINKIFFFKPWEPLIWRRIWELFFFWILIFFRILIFYKGTLEKKI